MLDNTTSPTLNDREALVTYDELARILHLSKKTLQNYKSKGVIRARTRWGRHPLFDPHECRQRWQRFCDRSHQP